MARGCTFCNTCVFECPAQAIDMTAAGAAIDASRCTGCGVCVTHCASEAIIRVAVPAGSDGESSNGNHQGGVRS